MIDAMVAKLTEWFNKYRKISLETPKTQKLIPFVEDLLHIRCEEATLLPVTELNSFFLEYDVIGVGGSSYVHAIAAAIEAAKKTGTEVCAVNIIGWSSGRWHIL